MIITMNKGPCFVSAFISEGDILITFASSMGNVSVSIVNSNGQTVYSSVVNTTISSTLQFPAPTVADTYTLTIQSSTYHGEGGFIIYN